MPAGLSVKENGVEITFTEKVDPETAGDPDSYAVEQWNYVWSQEYGSPEVSANDPNQAGHDTVEVASAKVSQDGRSVFLEIPDIKPVMQMEIKFNIDAADGTEMEYSIHNTVNRVGKDKKLIVRAPGK